MPPAKVETSENVMPASAAEIVPVLVMPPEKIEKSATLDAGFARRDRAADC